MPTPAERIDHLVRCLQDGAADLLAAEIDAVQQEPDASPDVLSVAAFAALRLDRPPIAYQLGQRALEGRNAGTLEDGTILAWFQASEARFSAAVDTLRMSMPFRTVASALFPLVASVRFDVLIRAASEADIPVLDTTNGRLLSPEDVRRDATEQVRAELGSCVERCRGTSEASHMARELVRIGKRCGNDNGNWGHVFATVARMIDDTVEGADALLLT